MAAPYTLHMRRRRAFAGGRYEDGLTAAVALGRAPVDIAGLRNPIDESRQVVLLKQHMAFEFEGPH